MSGRAIEKYFSFYEAGVVVSVMEKTKNLIDISGSWVVHVGRDFFLESVDN